MSYSLLLSSLLSLEMRLSISIDIHIQDKWFTVVMMYLLAQDRDCVTISEGYYKGSLKTRSA